MGVNIRDVAKACNVSVATASRALNGKYGTAPKTRQRIVECAQNLGYRPFPNSELLAQTRSPNLALVPFADFASTQRNYFYFVGLQAAAREMERCHGAFTVPSTGALAELCDTPFHLSTLRGVEAVLVLYRRLSDAEYEGLDHANVPYLIVGERTERRNAGYIRMDLAEGARLAVRHLAELGHRRIAYWAWDLAASHEGFLAQMAELGLPVEDEWVVRRRGYPAKDVFPWDMLRSPDCPTAFFCHNDDVALELIRQMRNVGREAPRDYSVVGFDDLPGAEMNVPRLTTIRQPVDEMTVDGIRALLRAARGEGPLPRKTVPARLIVRESTGPAPTGKEVALT